MPCHDISDEMAGHPCQFHAKPTHRKTRNRSTTNIVHSHQTNIRSHLQNYKSSHGDNVVRALCYHELRPSLNHPMSTYLIVPRIALPYSAHQKERPAASSHP